MACSVWKRTRDYFIDLLLRESGWDPHGIDVEEYPVTGMPASTTSASLSTSPLTHQSTTLASTPLSKQASIDQRQEGPALSGAEGKGFVDYVLWGDDGLPLAVVEAKRTRKNSRVGQQQRAAV